jgi:hypothetical protein
VPPPQSVCLCALAPRRLSSVTVSAKLQSHDHSKRQTLAGDIPYGPNPANHVRVFRPPGSPGLFNGNCLSSLPGAIREADSRRIDLQYAESGISFLRNFFELRFAHPLYNDVNPAGGIGGAPIDPRIVFIVLP